MIKKMLAVLLSVVLLMTADPDALPWATYFDPYTPEPVSQPHILTYALAIGGAVLAAGILTAIILSAKKKKKG